MFEIASLIIQPNKTKVLRKEKKLRKITFLMFDFTMENLK